MQNVYQVVLFFCLAYFCSSIASAQETGNNPLADRMYKSASFLFTVSPTDYYLTRSQNGQATVVAVHKIPIDQPIINFTIKDDPADPGSRQIASYPEDYIAFVSHSLVPELKKIDPKLGYLEIHHYVDGVHLGSDPSMSYGAREQPIVSTKFQLRAEGWRPYYEQRNKYAPQNDVTTFIWGWSYEHLTAGEARDKYVKAVALREELSELRKVKKADKRRTVLDRIVSEAEATIASGYVYRSPAYWIKYSDPMYLRSIFRGDANKVNTEAWYFRYYFNTYVVAYSKNCQAYLPKRVPIFEIRSRTQVFNGWGNIVSEKEMLLDRIYVKPRLFEKYAEYQEDTRAPDAIGQIYSWLKGEVPYNVTKGFEALNDMELLLVTENCNSPTLHQFAENLLRMANGKPTMQSAGDRTPNANKDSMSLDELKNPKTFGHACMAHYSYEEEMQEWCGCLERQYREVLSVEEKRRYIADFDFFSKKKVGGNPSANDPDFEWRLVEPANACRN